MLVNIIQNFDFGSRRYLNGENVDIDPQIGLRWVAEGKATTDTDGVQNGATSSFSGLGGSPTDNTLLATALALRVMSGTGNPNGVVSGTAGQYYVQVDAPYPGALYLCAGGTSWSAVNNNATLATLPAASAATVNAIYTVTDANYLDGVGSLADDFITKQHGASYFWVNTKGFWPIYRNRTLSADVTGGTVFTQTATLTLPNRADMFPPGMDLDFEMHAVVTNHAGGGTVNQVVRTSGAAQTFMNQQIAGAGTSGAQRMVVRVGAVGAQFGLPSAAGTGGYTSSTGVDQTFAITLPNTVIQFGLTPSSASDHSQVRQADLTIRYAA